AELGLHRRERLDALLPQSVQVPPAGSIRYEVELAVRTPFGLKDRLFGPAGDRPLVAQGPVAGEVGQPQLRAVPGHTWVVPAQPGEAATVWADARRRIEVMARSDRAGVGRAIGWQRDKLVHRLRTLRRCMSLSNADQESTVARTFCVGVAQSRRHARLGRDRAG